MMNSGWIGFLGAVVGVVATLGTTWLKHFLESRAKSHADTKRKNLLKLMLSNPKYEWRQLHTLSRVVGCTEEETKLLLIEIEARGSTKLAGDGGERWALISRKPLPVIDDAPDE